MCTSHRYVISAWGLPCIDSTQSPPYISYVKTECPFFLLRIRKVLFSASNHPKKLWKLRMILTSFIEEVNAILRSLQFVVVHMPCHMFLMLALP